MIIFNPTQNLTFNLVLLQIAKIVLTLINMKFNNKITDNNFIVHIEGSNLTKYAKRYSEVSFKEEIDFNIDVSYIFCINLDFVFY